MMRFETIDELDAAGDRVYAHPINGDDRGIEGLVESTIRYPERSAEVSVIHINFPDGDSDLYRLDQLSPRGTFARRRLRRLRNLRG